MFPENGYLPQGSYLHITLKNADSTVSVQLNGIIENKDGYVALREIWKPGVGGDKTYSMPIGESILHSLEARNVTAGSLFVNYPIEIFITLGGSSSGYPVFHVLTGFLDNRFPICFPNKYVDPMTRLYRGSRPGSSSPAAGAPWVTNGNATMNLRPKYLGGTLVTDATAGNRNLYLIASFDGTTPSGFSFSTFNMVASNTYNFAFNLNCNLNTNQGNNLNLYLPDCVVGAGGRLEVGCLGIKATDQFQNFVCIFESFEN